MYQLNYFRTFVSQLWIKFLAYGVTAEQIGVPYIEVQVPDWTVADIPKEAPSSAVFHSHLFLLANWSFTKEMNLIADRWRLITYDMPTLLHKCQC